MKDVLFTLLPLLGTSVGFSQEKENPILGAISPNTGQLSTIPLLGCYFITVRGTKLMIMLSKFLYWTDSKVQWAIMRLQTGYGKKQNSLGWNELRSLRELIENRSVSGTREIPISVLRYEPDDN